MGFGAEALSPQARHPIVATALVIYLRIGPLIGLFDQTSGEHPFETPIKCAGTHLQRPIGLVRYVPHYGVAVAFSVREGKQNMEDWRGKGMNHISATDIISRPDSFVKLLRHRCSTVVPVGMGGKVTHQPEIWLIQEG
jgi:hypothetical protein